MGLLDALSTAERKVETLPLMFALSTSANPWELPNVTAGKSSGANMISVDQLISRLKSFVPSESVKQSRGNHLTDLSAYPGIKEGETQWDWMQRTNNFGNDRQGFGEIKETITKLQADPDAVSDKYVRLNGIMTSTENASRIMALSEDELKAQLLSDRALSNKRKAEEVVNAQNVKDAEAELAAKPKTRAQINAERIAGSGKTVGTTILEQNGKFFIHKDGSVVGNSDGYSSRGEALAVQQQLAGGSTPSLSGRPDIFAVEPTQAEKDAGIEPIVPQEGMEAVMPRVATPEELAAVQAGTLPTPAAEAAAVETAVPETTTSEPTSESALTEEQEQAADELADAIASDESLLYVPKVSPEDIQGYLEDGRADAAAELDPYYKEVLSRTKEAYLQGLLFETQARELTQRQEALSRAKEKKAIQDDLERRGATFTGEAAEELGVESGLSSELTSVIEGLFQKRQDLISTSSRQQFEKNIALMTQAAEEQLGTQAVQELTESDTSSLASSLFRVLGTSTPGAINRERTTNIETRGREIAQGEIAKELAMAEDFPTSDFLQYI